MDEVTVLFGVLFGLAQLLELFWIWKVLLSWFYFLAMVLVAFCIWLEFFRAETSSSSLKLNFIFFSRLELKGFFFSPSSTPVLPTEESSVAGPSLLVGSLVSRGSVSPA